MIPLIELKLLTYLHILQGVCNLMSTTVYVVNKLNYNNHTHSLYKKVVHSQDRGNHYGLSVNTLLDRSVVFMHP